MNCRREKATEGCSVADNVEGDCRILRDFGFVDAEYEKENEADDQRRKDLDAVPREADAAPCESDNREPRAKYHDCVAAIEHARRCI
jgi:hypothetical protein